MRNPVRYSTLPEKANYIEHHFRNDLLKLKHSNDNDIKKFATDFFDQYDFQPNIKTCCETVISWNYNIIRKDGSRFNETTISNKFHKLIPKMRNLLNDLSSVQTNENV